MATTSLIFLPKQAIRRKANKGKPSSRIEKKKKKGKAYWESVLKNPFRQIFLQL
jgi:hypothetical protein